MGGYAMQRFGFSIAMMGALILVSGCATFMGEDPEITQAQQQAEFAEQAKYDQLQIEAERLRSEINIKKSELDSL
jgi:hypothetical protein